MRTSRRLLSYLGLITSGTALLGALTATPAMASLDASAHSINPTGAGTATFRAYGEHLYIYDNKADSMSVVVLNWRDDIDHGSTMLEGWNSNGAGSVVDYNLTMAEGVGITFQVCLGLRSQSYIWWASCGPKVNGFA